MDPTYTLIELLMAIQCRDAAEMDEHFASLREWISRGGFPPPTEKAIVALQN